MTDSGHLGTGYSAGNVGHPDVVAGPRRNEAPGHGPPLVHVMGHDSRLLTGSVRLQALDAASVDDDGCAGQKRGVR
jgi:hypothetical protein